MIVPPIFTGSRIAVKEFSAAKTRSRPLHSISPLLPEGSFRSWAGGKTHPLPVSASPVAQTEERVSHDNQ